MFPNTARTAPTGVKYAVSDRAPDRLMSWLAAKPLMAAANVKMLYIGGLSIGGRVTYVNTLTLSGHADQVS